MDSFALKVSPFLKPDQFTVLLKTLESLSEVHRQVVAFRPAMATQSILVSIDKHSF